MKSLLMICALSVLALTGCTQKHAVDSFEGPVTRLARDASFYVMVPADGRHGGKSYAGSGLATAQAVVTALSGRAAKAVQADGPEHSSAAQEKAKAAGLTHVFETTILNWEDRATEWSGRPDRITLKMTVTETATGKIVASSVARASSKWGTLGGDHPQDLVPLPTQQFVDRLF